MSGEIWRMKMKFFWRKRSRVVNFFFLSADLNVWERFEVKVKNGGRNLEDVCEREERDWM